MLRINMKPNVNTVELVLDQLRCREHEEQHGQQQSCRQASCRPTCEDDTAPLLTESRVRTFPTITTLTCAVQQLLRHTQRSVVRRRLDLQQFAHQRVNVHAVERLGHKVLLEVGSEGPEDGLHVHLSVMVAVIASVDVDDESLVGTKKKNYRAAVTSDL